MTENQFILQKKRVYCIDWYETTDSMWLSCSDKNAICEINKNSGEVKLLGSYPKHGIAEEYLSGEVVCVENKLVFTPMKANFIAILDLFTKEIEYIELEKVDVRYKKEQKFWRAVAYQHYVYMFGLLYPGIIRLDMNNKDVVYYTDWANQLGDISEWRKKFGYFKDGDIKDEENFYLPLSGYTGIVKVNLQTSDVSLIRLDKAHVGFQGMTAVNGDVFFTLAEVNGKQFYIFDRKFDVCNQVSMPQSGLYHAPIVAKQKVFFFPLRGDYIIEYDINEKKCKINDQLSELLNKGTIYDYSVAKVKQSEDYLFILVGGKRVWYQYNLNTHEVKEKVYSVLDEEFNKEWLKKYRELKLCDFRKSEIYVTDEELPIEWFLEDVLDFNAKKDFSNDENVGEKIFVECCKN